MSNIKEAVDTLEVISQDEIKRMEYNARQKAIWDYNTLMEENFFRGIEKGRAEGRVEGMETGIEKGRAEGRAEGIADLLARMAADGVPEEIIKKYTQL